MTEFQGFSDQTIDFFVGLTFNNDKYWFQEHKEEYETFLKAPFQALADEVLASMRETYPKENFYLHVSRIYRDARRLYGKGPFQDNLWFTIQKGTPQAVGPVFWFELTPFSYSYGLGQWESTAANAEMWRAQIASDPAAFEKLIRNIEKKGPYKLYGYEYKRPKGHISEVIDPWYNRKGVSIGYECGPDEKLFTPQIKDELLQTYQDLMPLYHFYRKIYERSL